MYYSSGLFFGSIQSMFVQLPVIIVSVAGVLVVLKRRRQAPEASRWALIAFGLVFLLCGVTGVAQQLLWQLNPGALPQARAELSMALNFCWSMIRAASYMLLLVAVYTGRKNVPDTAG